MSTAQIEESAQRILNSGKEIELKKIGKVTVCELCLEDVLQLSKELADILGALQDGSSGSDGMGAIVAMLQTPATSRAIRLVASATTNRDPADYEKMGVADWLKWANAFKEVADWEELRELFMLLVPTETLKELAPNLSQAESPQSSTPSRKSTGGLPKRS